MHWIGAKTQAQCVKHGVALAYRTLAARERPVQQSPGIDGHLRNASVQDYFFSMFQSTGQDTAGVGFQLIVLRVA